MSSTRKRLTVAALVAGCGIAAGVALWLGSVRRPVKESVVAGTVADRQGKPLPAAWVTALKSNVNLSVTVATDSRGQYTISHLPAGVYLIEFRKPGFQPARRSTVALEERQSLSVDAVLVEETGSPGAQMK